MVPPASNDLYNSMFSSHVTQNTCNFIRRSLVVKQQIVSGENEIKWEKKGDKTT